MSVTMKHGSNHTHIGIVFLLLLLFKYTGLIGQQLAGKQTDGKLLRGEVWQRFTPKEKADFYVSPAGNDAWSGTLADPLADGTDGPFATIEKAQMAVRDLKSKVFSPKEPPVETRWIGSPHPLGKGRDILVYIREGFYTIEKPLAFKPEDGGERVETNLPTGAFEYHKLKDHYVTYAAYPGEHPVISGGARIKDWKKKGKFWTAKTGATPVQMLVYNGKKQTLARTPNDGYFVPPRISETTGEMYFEKGQLEAWKDMEDNRVIMLLRWHQGINSFGHIDEKNHTAWFKKPQDGVIIVPPRYYVENVKALLDMPGEWYHDRKTGEISLITPAPDEAADPNNAMVSAPQLDRLIVVKGARGAPVRNVRFYGLTFEGALPGNSAISFEYAHGCELVDSEIRSCGGTGLSIQKGCYQTRILSNSFDDIDWTAVSIHGPEDPESGKDILRETWVSYNKIANCGGVNIDASFSLLTTISHNYITKTRGRYAISVGGWHNLEEAIDGAYTVEYNHLFDVQKDADDSGAIKTAGTTFNSVVRNNLIHDVRAGFFNDNVGFWFDNMSLGWIAEDNIFYNLEQGEMKLCAANLVDNIYRNNHVIEAPAHEPETIIDGRPDFRCSNLQIKPSAVSPAGKAATGSDIAISASVENTGSTGIQPVELYLDGRIVEKKPFPVIHNNRRDIHFNIRIYDEGTHEIAIGNSEYKSILVEGNKPSIVFEDLSISDGRILQGESVQATAMAKNLAGTEQKSVAKLYLNNVLYESVPLLLQPRESKEVRFVITPEAGSYSLRIENSNEASLLVQKSKKLDLSTIPMSEYCSAKALPYEINANQTASRYTIKASGSDFFHAEDSYASVFLKQIKGDFVTVVKIKQFGDRTHEWFRAGLFIRNDMTRSFDTKPGSKGSVLMFGTPGRAGIYYDEFANGCMHKASSQNLPENTDFPIWLKLARHGNRFTGAISLDGENWIDERRTSDIPGLEEAVDIGLAAGSCDKIQYWVEFDDWSVEVAQ